jgi:F-type H+-transporting ATPase subunit gamma
MASLKDLRRRIRSTKSMQQIFKAMEMVAAAKLRRAQARAQASAPYSSKIAEMLGHVVAAAEDLDHPVFKVREVKKTLLVVITSDRGFAGAYNSNLLRPVEERLRTSPPGSVVVVVVGRKGRDYLRRRGYPVLSAHTDLPGEASLELARTLAKELIDRYVSGEVDRVEVIYAHFVNALVRRTHTDVFLPIGADAAKAGRTDGGTIFEPSAEAIVQELLPRYTTARLYAAMADALASEQGARMIAMGSARKNAGELVDALTLTRNRLRQAAITKEIAELVGGAEALR